ncbi:MAG: hypothetical protein HDQ93_06085 [Desulfovibrio sp.]|nr:hypothetical protein [Desulfovibrio sp.]
MSFEISSRTGETKGASKPEMSAETPPIVFAPAKILDALRREILAKYARAFAELKDK